MVDSQMLSDRVEIADLLARYSHAVDRRRWDDLDDVFTPDATIDYTAMGGIRGDLAEVKKFLAESFELFASTQHLMGLPIVTVDGDEAQVVVACHNPMLFKGDDGPLMVCGLWYHERLVRTPSGWRIRELSEERCYIKTFSAKHSPKG